MLKVMLKSFAITLTILLTCHHLAFGECEFPGLESPAPDEISCVGRGICEYTKKFVPGGIVPSEKWIALLGIAAQEKFGPLKTANPDDMRTLRQKVSEMVQAYGFCIQTNENNYLRLNSRTALLTKKILAGTPRNKLSKAESEQLENFNKEFGMKTPFFSWTNIGKLSTFDKFFNIDRDKDGKNARNEWDNFSIFQRQQQFKSNLENILSANSNLAVGTDNSYNGLGLGDIEDPNLKACLSQIQRQITSSPAFAITKDQKYATNNEDLCKSLAKNCDLPSNDFCNHNKKGPQTQPESQEERVRRQQQDAFMGQGAK